MMKRKSQNKTDPLKTGTFLLFIALVFLAVYLFINRFQIFQRSSTGEEKKSTENDASDKPVDLEWEEYSNEEYGFRLVRPKLLYERAFENKGGYLFFIRFEETKFSIEKGLAIGVSDRTEEEEIEATKQSLRDAGGKLVNEGEINIAGQKGTRLDFEPEAEGEKRSVLVFSRENYTYSISTVPEQIQRIVDSFRFY